MPRRGAPPWHAVPVATALVLALPAAAAGSTSVNFGSTVNATNLRSDGAGMDGAFTFELGVFAVGFTPGAGNRGDWLDFWIALPNPEGAAAQAPYNDSEIGAGIFVNNFSGTAFIRDNASDPSDPLAPGQTAYMWGFTGREAGASPRTEEWVLLGNDAWLVPASSPDSLPATLDWAVSDPGTYAMLGAVNPSFAPGAGAVQSPHMQSAQVLLSVPEPSALLLLAASAGALACATRRRPLA